MSTKAGTFSDFKQEFYSRFQDLSFFNCADFNLLKTVLDGLRVNYVGRSHVPVYIFRHPFLLRLIFTIKRLRLGNTGRRLAAFESEIKKYGQRRYAVLDSCVSNTFVSISGKKVPRYFKYVLDSLPEEEVVLLQDQLRKDEGVFHIYFRQVEQHVHFSALTAKDWKLLRELKGALRGFQDSGRFSAHELSNIKVAMQIFFYQFRFYHFLFSRLQVRYVFFNMHYHREGGMLAMKRLGIKTVELQHGLIAPEDIFYVFPEMIGKVRHLCLFPDWILTFGDHWTAVLKGGHEFAAEQIIKSGYSIAEQSPEPEVLDKIKDICKERTVVLVTTQTSFHAYFCSYVLNLTKREGFDPSRSVIIVKPHPSEKAESYSPLENIEGVKVLHYPLEYLFPFADLHVSVYSTSLFDAARFGVPSFALLKPGCEDYVRNVVGTGVARLLREEDDIFSYKLAGSVDDPTRFYEPFNHQVIESVINQKI